MVSLCKNLRLARHGANYVSHRIGSMRTFTSNRPLLTKPYLQVKSQSSTSRFLVSRAFHNVAPRTGDDEPDQFVRKINKAAPAHYLVQIDSFSRFEKLEVDEYEMGVFEAGGYKWSLRIHPDPLRDEEKTKVPVKLCLADTSALPENREFDAVFSICLKNQISGCYYFILGREHIDATNTEFLGFFPKHFLANPSYEYLKNDTCVFGAEVFVNRTEVVTENMSLKNVKLPPLKEEFKIPNFPSLKDGWVSHQTWTSEVFRAGGHDWKLKVSPRGWEEGIGRLSIFLENIVDSDDDDEDSDDDSEYVEASFTITLKSQFGHQFGHDNVKHRSVTHFSKSVGDKKGWRSFIDLASLNDPDKGFIVDDCVHLELELSVGRG